MSVLDFIALIFAVRGIVDVWRNGEIFAERVAVVEVHAGEEVEHTWRKLPYNILTLWGYVWGTLDCAYCFTRSAGLLLALSVCTLAWQPAWLVVLVRTTVYGFAAAELSWILNKLLPDALQHDRSKLSELGGPDSGENPGSSTG